MTQDTSQDPRVRRTKNRLQKALMALIIEKGYQHLTVQEIVDRADVNRTTFYRQFQDKEELMHFVIDNMVEQTLNQLGRPAGQIVNGFTLITGEQLADLFKRSLVYEDLFKAMVDEEGSPAFHYQFIKTFEAVLYQKIEQSGININHFPIPISMVVTYLTNGYIAILLWWLSHHEEHSAKFIADNLIELMKNGIYKTLDLGNNNIYWEQSE